MTKKNTVVVLVCMVIFGCALGLLWFVKQLSLYEALSLGLAAAGLIGLYIYVSKTVEMAKATSEHNAIIARPAVTVKIVQKSQLDHIGVLVQNHTAIHANVRILIKYAISEDIGGPRIKVSTPFLAGNYNGKEVWNIPARDEFYGHTSLEKLKGKSLKDSETVILTVESEASPFGEDAYEPGPPRQYRWKKKTESWIPYPVPRD